MAPTTSSNTTAAIETKSRDREDEESAEVLNQEKETGMTADTAGSTEKSEGRALSSATTTRSDDIAASSSKTSSGTSSTSGTRRILQGKTIFVTGLAPRITKLHIEKLMSKFGTAVRIDFKEGGSHGGGYNGNRNNYGANSGGGKRYCFVEFSIREDAQQAMDNLNGKMLSGLRLVVQPAHERQSTSSSSTNNQFSASGEQGSNCGMSIHKEKKMIDRKIEDLRRKIMEKQQQQQKK